MRVYKFIIQNQNLCGRYHRNQLRNPGELAKNIFRKLEVENVVFLVKKRGPDLKH